MALDDSYTEEQQQGSIIPGIAGAAVGGATGAVLGYKSSQKNAARGLTLNEAAQGTPLGLVKEHMAAEGLASHTGDKKITDAWEHYTQGSLTKPKEPKHQWTDNRQTRTAKNNDYRNARNIFEARVERDRLKEKVNGFGDTVSHESNLAAQELKVAEAHLHNTVAECIAETHNLKPLEEKIAKEVGEVTKKMPKGGFGKAAVVGTALAAVAGFGAQAMFGGASRPHNTHAARIRAQQAAAQQQQQQGLQA